MLFICCYGLYMRFLSWQRRNGSKRHLRYLARGNRHKTWRWRLSSNRRGRLSNCIFLQAYRQLIWRSWSNWNITCRRRFPILFVINVYFIISVSFQNQDIVHQIVTQRIVDRKQTVTLSILVSRRFLGEGNKRGSTKRLWNNGSFKLNESCCWTLFILESSCYQKRNWRNYQVKTYIFDKALATQWSLDFSSLWESQIAASMAAFFGFFFID